MSDIDYARLMQCIEYGINVGIKRGMETQHKRVVFQKYHKLDEKDLKVGQPSGSYGWSEDWFDGTLLDLHSVTESQEICTVAIVEQMNGELISVDISRVKVVK